MPPEKIYPEFKDIGGGLLASIADGAIAHWNVDVPGVGTHVYADTGRQLRLKVLPSGARHLSVNWLG